MLRIAFGWDAMEPERGRFDWSFWDEFVRMAVDDFGLRLIPYACYTPKWAAHDPGENFWHSPPRDPEDFGRFMTALVQRYGHAIHSWELWNEPDNQAYWTGTAKVAAWPGMPASEKDPARSRREPAADDRRAVVRVRFPGIHASAVHTTDAVGRPVPASVATWRREEDSTELELKLSGGALFLSVVEP